MRSKFAFDSQLLCYFGVNFTFIGPPVVQCRVNLGGRQVGEGLVDPLDNELCAHEPIELRDVRNPCPLSPG